MIRNASGQSRATLSCRTKGLPMSEKERSRSQVAGLMKQKQQRRKPDERTRRTHERLGSALVQLIQEKPIDKVTVQEVLDRASVGRSTFYFHFRDKDDLFLSQLEQGLEMWTTALSRKQEKSHRVAPVREFFEHVGSARKFYRALADAGRLSDFFDLAQGYFARGIEQRLMESKRLPRLQQRAVAVRGVALAGSLLSLLRWWMDRGAKEAPSDMDDLFHQMVWKGLQ
jgi:AcrR family transcriptional regulator